MRWGESEQKTGQRTYKQAVGDDQKMAKGGDREVKRKNVLLRFHELLSLYDQLPRFVPGLDPKPLSSSASAPAFSHAHELLTCLCSDQGLMPTSHRLLWLLLSSGLTVSWCHWLSSVSSLFSMAPSPPKQSSPGPACGEFSSPSEVKKK